MADFVSEELPAPEGMAKEETGDGEKKKRGRPKGSTNKPKLDALQEKLTDALVAMSLPVSGVSPLSSMYLMERAEKNAAAICVIAAHNPKLRKGIEKFIEGSTLVDIPITVIGVVTCMRIERGADPDSVIAQALKIDAIFAEVYPNGIQIFNEETSLGEDVEARGVLTEVD
jgi:hypothetical protein